jgi:hypothetical protein
MKFLRQKFNHLFRPGPLAPPDDGSEATIQATESRLQGRPRHVSRRLDELRPCVPPPIIAAYKRAGDSTSQQIIDFLKSERPELARLFEEELQGSRRREPRDLRGALGRMGDRKASEAFNGRHTMSRLAAAGELVVALPVPPHLEDWVCEQVDEGMVFLAEDPPPPHLEESNLRFINDLLPQEIHETFANVKGILAEGQLRGGASTRRSVVRLIQMLPGAQVTLFLHHMPHRPPHAEFAQVDRAVEVVEVP